MRRRLRGSVGATLVEYSLIIALVSVPSIGAVNFLTKQAKNETNNQADCISTRPPPASCQVRPVTTTTIVSDPVIIPPPPPGPTDPDNPPIDPDNPPDASVNVTWNAGQWVHDMNTLTTGFHLQTASGDAVSGVSVEIRIAYSYKDFYDVETSQVSLASCITQADGTCTITWPGGGPTWPPDTYLSRLTATLDDLTATANASPSDISLESPQLNASGWNYL